MEIFGHSSVFLQVPVKMQELGHGTVGCVNRPLERDSLGERLNVLC